MFGLPLIDIIAIICYFVFVIIIGVWSSRRIKNQEDYFLAGRRFGKFVQTFAAFGQGTSAETAVGMTVVVARNGIAGICLNLTSLFGLPVFWLTSVWYRRLRILTLGDFFEERYGSKKMAAFYAVMTSLFFVIVIGLGFKAMTTTILGVVPKPIAEFTSAERMEYDRALEFEYLEGLDSKILTSEQKQSLEVLRIENPSKEFSYINENLLMWIIAIIVVLYAAAGGLEAAFLTDTLQGIFILILTVLLLPFSCYKINTVFGGHGLDGIVSAAKTQLPESFFDLLGSPALADLTWYYLAALTVMIITNTLVQANMLTACGSAKDEYTARFGFTMGIYIKRVSTLLWGVTALLLLVLYSNTIKNPDYMWGFAVRDLLGPVGIGLVGLMIACLMAALMSTADALMITSASLLTHNLVRPLFPELSEKAYVWIGRFLGMTVVFGGVVIASSFDGIFSMLKIIWEFNIVLAAAFLLGLKWRKANRIGAWASMLTAFVVFGLLPTIIPLIPGSRSNQYLLKTVEPITVVRTYIAREYDVTERNNEIANWQGSKETAPEALVVGQRFDKTYETPARSIFWTQGLKYDGAGVLTGSGLLNVELVILDRLGFDLSKNAYALNETIKVLLRVLIPFSVLIIVSMRTKPDDKERLDRFFVKMKTPVQDTKEHDQKELELSYADPQRFDNLKMFAKSSWEFEKFDKTDLKGISWTVVGGAIIIIGLFLIARLGS